MLREKKYIEILNSKNSKTSAHFEKGFGPCFGDYAFLIGDKQLMNESYNFRTNIQAVPILKDYF
jgi:hypothetical protein